jgi:putative transposase
LGVPESSFYRRLRVKPSGHKQPGRTPARALSQQERQLVLEHLCSERFVDRAPAEVVATLLDEGTYLCSERTMYRILEAERAVKERRNQRRHPSYAKPEQVASQPNEVWSWDITRLRGPRTWSWLYLYVILDSCAVPRYVE